VRFWQAAVMAQMAASSVYADRYAPGLRHMVWEASGLLFGAVGWWLCKRAFGTIPNESTPHHG